jgi:hypothetical protein
VIGTTTRRSLGRTSDGPPGQRSPGPREYRPLLGGRFILSTDETRWEPSSEEPDGSLHEDLTVLHLDRAADQLVMRAFYSEGLVKAIASARCPTPRWRPVAAA